VGAYMDDTGIEHAFIATPIPLPFTLTLLGSGLLELVELRRFSPDYARKVLNIGKDIC
jgi:hypothetical protein